MCDCLLIEKSLHRTRSLADARFLVSIPRTMWTRFVRENSAKLLSRRPAKNTDEVHRPYTITVSTVRCTFIPLASNPLFLPPLLHTRLLSLVSFRVSCERWAQTGFASLAPIEQVMFATCLREVDA